MKQDWSQRCHADWCQGLGWLALITLLLSMTVGHAWAQTPNPVTPGYQICSTASGSTKCSFQPADTTHGLPVAAFAVATCGAQSLTAGTPYIMTMDLTGTLCTAGGGGGGGGPATIADGADVAEGSTIDSPASTPTTATAATMVSLMKALVNSNVSSVPAGTNIIGKVSQDTSPWVVSGTVTAAQATAANLNATVVGTGTFAVQSATQGAVNITLTDCSGTIASGTVAQNAFTAAATRHGFTIANIDTTETLWISFTTTAAASGTGSYPLGPADATTFSTLSSFTSPVGMGINTALSVVAATTSHKFSCTVW